MSIRVCDLLASCDEFNAVDELAQVILGAIWKKGVVRRFAPLGRLTARDVILGEMRRKNLLHRDGVRPLFDTAIQQLIDAEALIEEGDDLMLPILSKDRAKPVPTDPAVVDAKAYELWLNKRRQNRFRVKKEFPGDTRSRKEVDDEYELKHPRPGAAPPAAPGTSATGPVTRHKLRPVTTPPAEGDGVTEGGSPPPESGSESVEFEDSSNPQTQRHSGNSRQTTSTTGGAAGTAPRNGGESNGPPRNGPDVTLPAVLPALANFGDTPDELERLYGLAVTALSRDAGPRFDGRISAAVRRQGFARLLRGGGFELDELISIGAHWRVADLVEVFPNDPGIKASGVVTVGLLLGTRAGDGYEGGRLDAARAAHKAWREREAKAAATAAATAASKEAGQRELVHATPRAPPSSPLAPPVRSVEVMREITAPARKGGSG